ncbi:MAG: hypothetical protein R2813_13545 [Flavobacteriales bacterium]
MDLIFSKQIPKSHNMQSNAALTTQTYQAMTTKDLLVVMMLISILLSIVGFSIDSDEWGGSISLTIFEFLMMTMVQFGIIAAIFFGFRFIFRKIKLLS